MRLGALAALAFDTSSHPVLNRAARPDVHSRAAAPFRPSPQSGPSSRTSSGRRSFRALPFLAAGPSVVCDDGGRMESADRPGRGRPAASVGSDARTNQSTGLIRRHHRCARQRRLFHLTAGNDRRDRGGGMQRGRTGRAAVGGDSGASRDTMW